MGLTHVAAEVSNVRSPRRRFRARFLVDSGSFDTLVPAAHLRKIGIRPVRTDRYELADGRVVEYPVGHAILRFDGVEISTDVVFGPAGAEPLLGAIALETAGLVLEPRRRRLVRLPAKSLK